MTKIIIRWFLNALFLILITYLIPGIVISNIYSALATALILGVVNALIRPILIILTLPINILTLGLFTLVINGLLFWFVSSFVKGFEVTGFLPAFFGALLLSVFTSLLNSIEKKD